MLTAVREVTTEPASSRRFAFWGLLASVALLAALLLPLWRPLLLAAVVATGLCGSNERCVLFFRGHRWPAAAVMTLGANLLILAPVFALVATALSQADEAAEAVKEFVEKGSYNQVIQRLPTSLAQPALQYAATLPKALNHFVGSSGALAKSAVGGLSVLGSYLTQYALMTVAMFFFFLDGARLRHWMADNVPLRNERTRQIVGGFGVTARAVLGANILTALAQACVAMVGYLLAHVPQPFFFGLLTFFTSFFPGIGTAIVAVPLSLLLYASGHTYAALFLVAWAVVVVGLVDNILRPMLTRGKEHFHGAVVFFALVGGVALFGAVGLVLGPLSLSLFLSMLRLWKQESV